MIEVVSDQWPEHLIRDKTAPEDEQIIQIEDAECALAHPIGAKDGPEGFLMLFTPGVALSQDLGERPLRVDCTRVDIEQRAARGKRRRSSAWPSSWRTKSNRSAASPASSTPKPASSPTEAA